MEQSEQTEHTGGRAALAFILVTVLVDTIGFGIIIPVMPQLIMQLTGEGVGRAAIYGGWLMFLYSLMQFFFAPVLGNLSDRFGRRPVLLLSLAAFGLDYLVMGFAPTIVWLFIGRFFAGIFGASFSSANAYVADVTPPEERAQNFGLLGAAWGLGFILGPVIGGFLGEFGARVPFFAAAALALLNVLYGLFVLPESLPQKERRPFSLGRANPIGALFEMRRYPVVFVLFGAVVLYQIAHDVNPSIWTYYGIEKFGWSERDIGLSLGFVGLMVIIVQAGLIRLVIPKFGERLTAFAGLFMFGLGFLGIALATTTWMVYLAIIPMALGGLAMPAIRGIMSNQVPANGQGELAGAITSLISLTAIFTPLLMTRLFGYFTLDTAPVYFPGAPFALAAVLIGISALIVARALAVAPPAAEEKAPA